MSAEYECIGWIAHGMDKYKPSRYVCSRREIRKPPKIYRTEEIANRYGEAKPVYIKKS